jgi:hypothetical protein
MQLWFKSFKSIRRAKSVINYFLLFCAKFILILIKFLFVIRLLGAIRQSVIDFVDALGHGVDGQAIPVGNTTQGAFGLLLNRDAMHLLDLVETFRFKLEGYL